MTTYMNQAVRQFFIGGYDPIGQHKTPDDLAFAMQHELDLLAEGEENELTDSGRIRRAKQFVARWKGVTE